MRTAHVGAAYVGFSYARKGGNRCQGNRRGPVPFPAAQSLLWKENNTAPNTRGGKTPATTITPAVRMLIKNTDERGKESVTGMLQSIHFVRCVLLKEE